MSSARKQLKTLKIRIPMREMEITSIFQDYIPLDCYFVYLLAVASLQPGAGGEHTKPN